MSENEPYYVVVRGTNEQWMLYRNTPLVFDTEQIARDAISSSVIDAAPSYVPISVAEYDRKYGKYVRSLALEGLAPDSGAES